VADRVRSRGEDLSAVSVDAHADHCGHTSSAVAGRTETLAVEAVDESGPRV
jgi:hypothetical protein